MEYFKKKIGELLPVPSPSILLLNFFQTPSQSKFIEKGILIPQEFVTAGDQLVHTCPTWEWKPAIDARHKRSELPEDKQYLYTRVPCSKRVNTITQTKTIEKDVIN